jgi:hypothetical protein
VVAGGVVGHQVDDHPDAVVVGVVEEVVEGLHVAEDGVDVARVGDVVAVVDHGGGVERGQPDGVDAEELQVAQPGAHAFEVAQAVAVGIREGPDVDLVEHRVAPPLHEADPVKPGAATGAPERGRDSGRGRADQKSLFTMLAAA